MSLLWVVPGLLVGMLLGVAGAVLWLRRDATGRQAWHGLRQAHRRDHAREATVLGRENAYGRDVDRALKWARRAVRLDRRDAEAHAVLGVCRQAVDHYGQAIIHHRPAEDLATDLGQLKVQGQWRFQNAVDAVQACMRLRSEADDDNAQVFWDEAAAWARLAYDIDADNAAENLAISPWLASFTPHGGETWLRR